ncbi:NAD kinase [Allomuricauda sp. d1]|uniref:NAD kinase n=1 Tax=Allomuricauda sp. d1 TaxID=3136725 RepID=UPI0031D693C9
MKVAVYGQTIHESDGKYIAELLRELERVDAKISIERDFQEQLANRGLNFTSNTFSQSDGLDAGFELFISIGGDGTMLRAVTFIGNKGIPIVGVNTGRLGFLSTFKKEDVKKLVTEFAANNFSIEERSLVEISLDDDTSELGDINYALNEVTVSRKDTTSMITVETYLDEEYLTSYWADGLIVATPTGSTGYSLSCGGPVMAPTAKSLVLTPIAPHNLNARPLVISDDTEIRLKVSGREENHLVSLDSRIATIPNGKEIRIRKSNFTIKMVEYKSESFLKTLRNKLLWGEDRRN